MSDSIDARIHDPVTISIVGSQGYVGALWSQLTEEREGRTVGYTKIRPYSFNRLLENPEDFAAEILVIDGHEKSKDDLVRLVSEALPVITKAVPYSSVLITMGQAEHNAFLSDWEETRNAWEIFLKDHSGKGIYPGAEAEIWRVRYTGEGQIDDRTISGYLDRTADYCLENRLVLAMERDSSSLSATLSTIDSTIVNKGILIVHDGPTGIGKSEISLAIFGYDLAHFEHALMATTRSPRQIELKGGERKHEHGQRVGYYVHLTGAREERLGLFRRLEQEGLIVGGVSWGPRDDLYGVMVSSLGNISSQKRIPIITMAGDSMGNEIVAKYPHVLRFTAFAKPDDVHTFLTKRGDDFPSDQPDFQERIGQYPRDVIEIFQNRYGRIHLLNESLPRYGGDSHRELGFELNIPIKQRIALFNAWLKMGLPEITDEFYYRLNAQLLERTTGMDPEQLREAIGRGEEVYFRFDSSDITESGHSDVIGIESSINKRILDFRRNRQGMYILVVEGPVLREYTGTTSESVTSDRRCFLDVLEKAAGVYPLVRVDDPTQIKDRKTRNYEDRFMLANRENFPLEMDLQIGAYFGPFLLDLKPKKTIGGLAVFFAPQGYPDRQSIDYVPFDEPVLRIALDGNYPAVAPLTYLSVAYKVAASLGKGQLVLDSVL